LEDKETWQPVLNALKENCSLTKFEYGVKDKKDEFSKGV